MNGMIARTRTTAIAVPRPTLKFLYISVYMRLAITSVWKLPPVITYTRSNSFRTLITIVVTTTVMVGRMMGTMILQNTVHSVAPSTRAASRISSGTDLSAAAKIVMQNPDQIQIPTITIIKVLIGVVESQAIGRPPNEVMMAFNKPICVCEVP